MKQLHLFLLIFLFSVLIFASCSEKEEEEEIAISDLPTIITSAIQDTLPGFKITEAEIESEDGQKNYEVAGIYNDKKYEVEISPDGKIIEIEEESEDHDEDDDSDEHEEDDD